MHQRPSRKFETQTKILERKTKAHFEPKITKSI